MKQKLLILLLSLFVVISLSACNTDISKNTNTSTNNLGKTENKITTSTEEPKKELTEREKMIAKLFY